MLDEIKKIQGINHDEFDEVIESQIEAAKLDLKRLGIVDSLIEEPDDLVKSAIYTYVISFLDVNNSEMYANSYALKKDELKRTKEYIEE